MELYHEEGGSCWEQDCFWLQALCHAQAQQPAGRSLAQIRCGCLRKMLVSIETEAQSPDRPFMRVHKGARPAHCALHPAPPPAATRRRRSHEELARWRDGLALSTAQLGWQGLTVGRRGTVRHCAGTSIGCVSAQAQVLTGLPPLLALLLLLQQLPPPSSRLKLPVLARGAAGQAWQPAVLVVTDFVSAIAFQHALWWHLTLQTGTAC